MLKKYAYSKKLPDYSLPDLSFLKKHDYSWIGDALLTPQYLSGRNAQDADHSQRSFHELKKQQMGHVKDWESLKILLPEEIRQQVNSVAQSGRKPRPKSCGHGVLLREKAIAAQYKTAGYRSSSTWADAGLSLSTVPQSPVNERPPPLPERTASLPFHQLSLGTAAPGKTPSPSNHRDNRPRSSTIGQIRSKSVQDRPTTLCNQPKRAHSHIQHAPNALRKTVRYYNKFVSITCL